jgi:hypothetical protein
VHFDSGGADEGDVFSAYDIVFFIETSGHAPPPAVEDVKSVLEYLTSEGMLTQYGNRFGV